MQDKLTVAASKFIAATIRDALTAEAVCVILFPEQMTVSAIGSTIAAAGPCTGAGVWQHTLCDGFEHLIQWSKFANDAINIGKQCIHLSSPEENGAAVEISCWLAKRYWGCACLMKLRWLATIIPPNCHRPVRGGGVAASQVYKTKLAAADPAVAGTVIVALAAETIAVILAQD
jgi:hypothetical protein